MKLDWEVKYDGGDDGEVKVLCELRGRNISGASSGAQCFATSVKQSSAIHRGRKLGEKGVEHRRWSTSKQYHHNNTIRPSLHHHQYPHLFFESPKNDVSSR